MNFEREVEFLSKLRDDLVGRFGDETGETLFAIAAAEFFSGPKGVTAMFERAVASTGKSIPENLRKMSK